MYTSIIEIQFQPGKMDEAMKMIEALQPDLEQLGCRQLIFVDKGNDAGLALAIYDSQTHQEAATSKAQEILGRLAPLCAAVPERKGGEVKFNENY